jgi:hypothetical protein
MKSLFCKRLIFFLFVVVFGVFVEHDAKHLGRLGKIVNPHRHIMGNTDVANKVTTGVCSVITKAIRQSLFEQEVEDSNSVHKMDDHLVRRLIVMPLTEQFRPNQADAMHGKVQYGDKCSLPVSLGRLIFEKRYEVPWLFEMTPVAKTAMSLSPQENEYPEVPALLSKTYISPLDFRAPDNYIFIPQWIMKDLGLSANDLVDISFLRMKLASLVVLQPLSLEWDDLVKQHPDPKSLLEHELNKYSSLTSGSTISISIRGGIYTFYVKETYSEGGVRVHGVRIQDADVHTDIDRSVLDTLLSERKKLTNSED